MTNLACGTRATARKQSSPSEKVSDIRAGRTKPARTALKALAKKYGITPEGK
ncbi:MAG: hypothetical protein KDA86_20500 [Planctomycetaceae bacterium]|nr:hypothetical protein [Planctomycetaceae bacterium]